MNTQERRHLRTILEEVKRKREECTEPPVGQYLKGKEDLLTEILEKM